MVLSLWWVLAAVPVEVTADGCAGLDVAEVQRIARIELGHSAEKSAPVVAHLTCEADALQVAVDDPVTRKSLARRISFAGVDAKARERTAALALAELVQASWSELLLPPPKVAPSEPPSLSREEASALVPQPPPPPPRLRFDALGSMRWLPSSALVQAGAEVRAFYFASPSFAVGLAFGGEHGSNTVSAGRLDVDSLGGAALVVGAFGFGDLGLSLGGGVRGGGARVVGTAAQSTVAGATLSGGWLGPVAVAQLAYGGRHFGAALGVEGGWAAISVRGLVNGGSGAGIDGGWLGLTLGLEVRP